MLHTLSWKSCNIVEKSALPRNCVEITDVTSVSCSKPWSVHSKGKAIFSSTNSKATPVLKFVLGKKTDLFSSGRKIPFRKRALE